ncbi:MAG TPA: protease pro-enzyme activation domain-containing protein [Terracidiphilus sp.]|nr:protease pro-enzyme activation domain-containing protein [Terracidiphilus sp.]
MSTLTDNSIVPDGYVRLEGSERRPSKNAKIIGQVDDQEKFKVTIVLRRRKDGPPLPSFDYFTNTPPKLRKRLAADEFTEKYGAHPDDIQAVVQFLEKQGLQVIKTHAGRRTVEVEGTASQFGKAFGVSFARYQAPMRPIRNKRAPARPKTYRGREGFVHVPNELSEVIVGVFGLDNRPVSIHGNNPGDPPIVNTITVQQATQLYNFPPPGSAISGQTIGIIAPTGGFGGYFQSDIDSTFANVGLTAPQVINISVEPGVTNGTLKALTTGTALAGQNTLTFPLTTAIQNVMGFFVYPATGIPDGAVVASVTPAGTNATVTLETVNGTTLAFATGGVPSGTPIYFDGSPDATGETNQDICISGLAAAGANVACYFTDDTQMGWVDLVNRVLHPEAGDFVGVNPPSVLSASWAIAPGDDPDGISYSDTNWGTGITANSLQVMTAAFQDAAILQTGPTICICTGDYGSNQGVGRFAESTGTSTQITTTVNASMGGNVLTFASTTGVSVGSIGFYSDPVSGVWYYFQVTAVTSTTVTIQALDNATQAWVGTGLFDDVPMGTTIYFGFQFSGDGHAHVWYPGSDPWVLSVGGTTLGQYYPSGQSTPSWVEYAWNDAFQQPDGWGTGGGGVSDFFPLPSYQNGAGVPNSINPAMPTNPDFVTVTPSAPFNTTGRGTPDVAANASIFSGYSGFYTAGVLDGGNPGNGTSASTPFWAGLIAVLNSNAGFNIGFVNPTLYALGAGSSAFNPLNPLWRDPAYPQLAACPLDNSNNGIQGYPTGQGWDACTGLGSPNGVALLTAFTELQSVYILGGYQSPDIIITDLTTNQPVPIGGQPGGRWDTLLQPSTNYGFSANVHNDTSSAVNGVVVAFWAIPGGVGTNGNMVGSPQTISIPAHSTVNVPASAPFVSAAPGDHLCAVVSLYSPTTGCDTDATTALEIPSPGYSDTHQCSAWRNTDSMSVGPGGHFGFHLGLGVIHFEGEETVLLEINTKHVPAAWTRTPAALNIADTLRATGATSNVPLYLLPGLQRELVTVPVKPRVKAVRGLEVKEGEPGIWLIRPENGAEANSLEISGDVPEDTAAGDVLLVNVTATYPRTRDRAARTIEFLQFVYVNNRKKDE